MSKVHDPSVELNTKCQLNTKCTHTHTEEYPLFIELNALWDTQG